jgi:hypothetical protein
MKSESCRKERNREPVRASSDFVPVMGIRGRERRPVNMPQGTVIQLLHLPPNVLTRVPAR